MKYSPRKKEIVRYVYTIRVLIALVVVLSLLCGVLSWRLISINQNNNSSSKQEELSSEQSSLDLYTSSFISSSSSSSSTVSSISSAVSSKVSSAYSSKSSSEKKDTVKKDLPALADELDDWNLALVNKNNPLPKGYTVKTEKINASYARDVGMSYDSRAVSKLNEMCAAAAKDGVTLLVISAFRTNARQTTLYNNQVAKQKAKNPSLSDDEVAKLAATISAYPGTSEHELGLAIDFNSVEETFEHTSQFTWLKNHAAEYGFILRYEKKKESITGVIYEPWHYRYVGEAHAKKINELGYCLEEYIEYLKQYK